MKFARIRFESSDLGDYNSEVFLASTATQTARRLRPATVSKMNFRYARSAVALVAATLSTLAGCSSDNTTADASGGSASGGAASGGSPASGGQNASGGQGAGGLTGNGGQGTGGLTGTGGQGTGGQSAGGQAQGGNSAGGSASGGASSGGQSNGSGGAAAVPATFETFKDVVLEKCGGQGCHNDPQNPLQMKFTDSNLYKTITTHKVAKCSNMLAISAGKPQESAIIKVITGGCGSISRMPPSCEDDTDASCVAKETIAALTQWVMNGAPEK